MSMPNQGDPFSRRRVFAGWSARLFGRFWSSEVAGTAGLAAVVGALTGLGAVAFIELRLLVFEDNLAVDLMPYYFAAVDLYFGGYPLVAMVCFGYGACAVGGSESFVHYHVCARCAEVAGCAFVFAVAAEELDLYANGKILLFGHCFGVLAVNHYSAVADGPAGTARCLFADETILEADAVVRKFVLVEDMSEFAVELFVLVKGNFHHAILYAKGVAEVFAEVVTGYLRCPAVEVLAVEERYPF